MRRFQTSFTTPLLFAIALAACDEPPPIDPDPAPTHAAISAVVTHDGDPIANAAVRVTGINGTSQGFSRRTAANGWTRVDSLLPGVYTVSASASGYVASGRDTVVLEAGADITLNYALAENDPELSPYATVFIGVFEDSVTPYQGARVYIEGGGGAGGGPHREGTTDGNGMIHFFDVTPQTYSIMLTVPAGYEALPPGDSIMIPTPPRLTTQVNFHIRALD